MTISTTKEAVRLAEGLREVFGLGAELSNSNVNPIQSERDTRREG